MRIDEFEEKTEEESKKELEDYTRFVYIESNTLPDTSINKETSSTEPNIVTELQEVQTESQGPKSHPEATEPMPTKSEQPEPKVEVQEDENSIYSRGKEPVLANQRCNKK